MSDLNPKVSIIVPVYNVENYIRECLDCLVNQTLSDIEIICVDDCGSDASMSIVEEYAAADTRVRILRLEVNSGPAVARNKAMFIATAPYIMFCDSDDYYDVKACEKMYAALNSSPDADIGMCGAKVVHSVERGEEKRFYDELDFSVRYEGEKHLSAGVLRNITNAPWGKIYRRTFLEKNQIMFPEGLYYEDAYFFYVCAAHARKFLFIKENMYFYRRREDSIMRNTEQQNAKMGLDHLRIVMLLWDYYKRHGFLSLWGGYISELFARWLGYALFCAKKNKRITLQIIQMMREFVEREGFDSHNIPLHIARQLQNAKVTKKKYLFGLVKVREAFWDKRLYVCGIRVWKNARRLKMVREAFLGSPKYMLPSFTAYSADDSRLLSELKAIGKFTYIPGPGNMEDTAVMAATLSFFDTHRLPYSLSSKGCKFGDTIVFGGNGDMWSQDYSLAARLKIIYAGFRRAKKIVILPISVQNCPELIELMDERFVVFCREQKTFDILTSANTGARLIPDHDMALRTSDQFVRSISEKGVDYRHYLNYLFDLAFMPLSTTGYFLRQDRRSRGEVDAASLDLVDYSRRSEKNSVRNMLFDIKFMYIMLDMYQNIVTDRLQVAIAAARLGKQVYFMDDLYSINAEVYSHSLKEFSNIHFVKELPDMSAPAAKNDSNEVYYQSLLERCACLKAEIVRKGIAASVGNEAQCSETE